LTVEGVASVDVIGGLDREIQVVIDPERLRSYGLTVSELLDRLREENQDISAGRLRSQGRELLSKTKGKFKGVGDILQVRLPLAAGGDISVGDVAAVVDTYADDRIYTRMDLRPAVMVAVTKQPDANTVRVVDSCMAVLERLRRDRFFPPDVSTELIQDQAFYVRAAVSGVASAALAGGGLAMLVVFLFLRSFRRTLVIGTSIPIAILGCVALMGTADLTLNIMSLGGLALGIGMLVDNAIVMLENIDRHQRESEDPVEAAHQGAGEVDRSPARGCSPFSRARSRPSKGRIGGCCRACCAAAGSWWSVPWPPAPPASPSPPASAASSCRRSTTDGSASGLRCRPRLRPRSRTRPAARPRRQCSVFPRSGMCSPRRPAASGGGARPSTPPASRSTSSSSRAASGG
jgi:hypothetical protein